MEAGKLDRRVQFRRFTLIDDGFAQVESWVDYGPPVWAQRRFVSDGEQVAAAQVAARITARFLVRLTFATGEITPKDRLICEGREYDITGVKEIGRREGVEITAAARADT
jgi:SPP1 family predicted phage head-tail adaptor